MEYQWQAIHFEDLTKMDLYHILHLRQVVFVLEQNSAYLDLDGLDPGADHLLCMANGQLLAYLRSLPPGLAYPESALGRIVVAPAARGRQLGRELVRRGIDHNLGRWPNSGVRINAQSHLEAYYRDLGFYPDGKETIEDGIPHTQMLYRP